MKFEQLSTEALEIVNGIEAEYCLKTQYSIAVTLLSRIVAGMVEQECGLQSTATRRAEQLLEGMLPSVRENVIDQARQLMFPQEES